MTTQVNILDQPGGLALPAHLQGLAATSSDDMVSSGESLPRISIKGKQFTLKSSGEEDRKLPLGAPLDIIIFAADPPEGLAHTYFEGEYQEGESAAPECSSSDGLYPDSWAKSKQCTNCTECPKAVWGSAVSKTSGKDIKACRDVKHLLVANANDPMSTIYQLQVPTMSLKALTAYANKLKQHNLDKHWVITRVTFSDGAFPQLVFDFGGFLSEEFKRQTEVRALSDEVISLIHIAPNSPPAIAVTAPVVEAPAVVEEIVEDANAAAVWGQPSEAAAVLADHTEPAPVDAQPLNEPADEDTAIRDSTGAEWDPSIHATSRENGPVFTQNGAFRRKRGVAAVQTADSVVAQVVTEPVVNKADATPPANDPAAIDKILADW